MDDLQVGARDAGALGVMATDAAIDGVLTHASERILARILRGARRREPKRDIAG